MCHAGEIGPHKLAGPALRRAARCGSGDADAATASALLRRWRSHSASAATHSRFGCAVPAKTAAKQKQPLSSPGQGLFFLLRRIF
ncbi:hypothetical protein [Paenibacillus chitinolyticus]|uniref:hypothetical protein n=1 Tax=Paenibacillus chitinolyticus TaxID=79263 RepID=UPI001470547D|nr:hypothetical protein [Paenibacillus chitinolyticus]MCY9593171.1 hypothetical protein [Paenibacillus chitinolyticus]